MKKRLLFAALFSAALVSCTKDQVVEVQQDEIKFRVATENATKASAVYCNSNLMSAFQVWAEYYNGTGWVTYFGNETINVEPSTGVCSTENIRYWPELSDSKAINFYAVAGPATLINILKSDESVWTGSGNAPIIKDFVVKDNVNQQEDLLYSVAKYEDQPTGDVAAMNFRHALSQIEFRAKNTSYSLYVEISGVMVANVMSKGTFTFPKNNTGESLSTSNNWTTHVTPPAVSPDTDADNMDNAYNVGSWTLSPSESDRKSYSVSFNPAIKVDNLNDDPISLTLSNDKESVTNSMLLLPNEIATDAWENTDPKGTYLAVNCSIWNKAVVTTDGKTGNDVLLHQGWAVIPISFNWLPGNKYIYTFNFGNENGGIDGGTDPDTPTPGVNPVLVPISYTVTVDDFDKIVLDPTDMKK